MNTEVLTLNEERNVTLTTYIQDCGEGFGCVAKRPAVLILPGGAYQMCSDREADPVAFAFAKAGYHAFVLRYSVMDDCTWPNPLNDYEQAMTLIRSHADNWHIYEDKIAVIGFSAAGNRCGNTCTEPPKCCYFRICCNQSACTGLQSKCTGDYLRCRPENTTLLCLCNTYRQHGSDQQFH